MISRLSTNLDNIICDFYHVIIKCDIMGDPKKNLKYAIAFYLLDFGVMIYLKINILMISG